MAHVSHPKSTHTSLPKPSPPFVQTTPTLKPTLHPIKKLNIVASAYEVLIKTYR